MSDEENATCICGIQFCGFIGIFILFGGIAYQYSRFNALDTSVQLLSLTNIKTAEEIRSKTKEDIREAITNHALRPISGQSLTKDSLKALMDENTEMRNTLREISNKVEGIETRLGPKIQELIGKESISIQKSIQTTIQKGQAAAKEALVEHIDDRVNKVTGEWNNKLEGTETRLGEMIEELRGKDSISVPRDLWRAGTRETVMPQMMARIKQQTNQWDIVYYLLVINQLVGILGLLILYSVLKRQGVNDPVPQHVPDNNPPGYNIPPERND